MGVKAYVKSKTSPGNFDSSGILSLWLVPFSVVKGEITEQQDFCWMRSPVVTI